MKRILITGKDSYVGTSFEKYVKENYSEEYAIDTLDMIGEAWGQLNFSPYDTIFHVAGIAHSDSGKMSTEKEALYRRINTDLAVNTAKKAKAEGVKQFIFMSSIIVYGETGRIGKQRMIDRTTEMSPSNCYGDSKLQAEIELMKLNDEQFKVVILRCPMIYGKNSKGNFPYLEKIAKCFPIFPYVNNERSMLYVGNLTEFVRLMIKNEESGVFMPQNQEYSNTSELIKMIAEANGRKVFTPKGFAWIVKLLSCFVPKVSKAFGNLTYQKDVSLYKEDYTKYSLRESISETQKNE